MEAVQRLVTGEEQKRLAEVLKKLSPAEMEAIKKWYMVEIDKAQTKVWAGNKKIEQRAKPQGRTVKGEANADRTRPSNADKKDAGQPPA